MSFLLGAAEVCDKTEGIVAMRQLHNRCTQSLKQLTFICTRSHYINVLAYIVSETCTLSNNNKSANDNILRWSRVCRKVVVKTTPVNEAST